VSVTLIMREMAVEMPLCANIYIIIITWWSHAMIWCVILALLTRKPCSLLQCLLGYRLNNMVVSAQWAWCSFPINIECLILVTWWTMLDCCLTNILTRIHNNLIM
jgi:hypothetical protein